MFRFLIRFLGVLGLLLMVFGAIGLAGWGQGWDPTPKLAGEQGVGAQVASILLVSGLAAAGVALLVELISMLKFSAGRRSAVGANVLLQVAVAVVLLVGVNVWSFTHTKRVDCTRDGVFTLKPEVKEQLGKLRGETTVVVYQMNKTFGRFSDKEPDEYDKAADAKVVEKVNDLVGQLRQLGSRFRVVVLDAQQRDKERVLAEEVKRFPKLRAAVDAAQESSIFFCAGDADRHHVQRLAFHEFYQLDKTGSKQADGGRGNLVLLYQGVEPFARRVLAVEEKRPRVAVAVSHPWLSTEGPIDEYTLAGLRKTLTQSGFDVRDIILKKLVGRRGRGMRLENSALTMEESKSDQLEAQIQPLRFQILRDGQQIEFLRGLVELLKSNTPLDDLNKELQARGVIGRTQRLDDEGRKRSAERLATDLEELNRDHEAKRTKLAQREREMEELQSRERVAEGQRSTDLKKKMTALLAECDMLIVARMTLRDVGVGDAVPNSIHTVDENQLAAIKEFMKAGKPVLFCLGPTNEPADGGPPTPPTDNLESMLTEVGLVFAPQTVLYDSESDAIAASQAISFGRAGATDIPPVDFPEKVNLGGLLQTPAADTKPNPIADSMRQMRRSAGKPLDMRLRHPRPVYFKSLAGPGAFESTFVLTATQAWNEDQPFPTDDRPVPRYEQPKADDPTKGTRAERRRGPFPIGVAVETELPLSWFNERYGAAKAVLLVASPLANAGGLPTGPAAESLVAIEDMVTKADKAEPGYKEAKKVRLAAIGHGGWFAGAVLSPADETLLLNTTNWLLNRDDRLPKAESVWQYPRVDLGERDRLMWSLGAVVGLPAVFAWLGIVIWLVRRMR